MAGMLYYPLMNPPASVLNQALIYWDKIATILPPGDESLYMGQRLLEVSEAGLYQPVFPRELRTDDIYEATSALSQLTRRFGDEAVPGQALTVSPETGLHSRKLGNLLADELIRRGLARTQDDATHLIVSPLVQSCLLGMVARKVSEESLDEHGCTDADSLIPYTDSRTAHRLAFQPLRPRRRLTRDDSSDDEDDFFDHSRRAACWKIELGSLLPVPREDVLVSDLVAFRNRYDGERQRFMLALDRMVHRLQRDHEHPNDVLRHLRGELQQAREDLVAAGRSAGITWVSRSVAVTVAVAGSYAASKVVGSINWLLPLVPALAVNIATAGQVRRTAGAQAPLAYLHRVDRELQRSGTGL